MEEKYLWTQHSHMKMRHYRLTESRVKRIIRHPARIEEGVIEGAVAAMQPAEGKRYSEIWVMYVLARGVGAFLRHDSASPAEASLRVGAISAKGGPSKSLRRGVLLRALRAPHRNASRLDPPLSQKYSAVAPLGVRKIKVITAWRYPGRAPEHDPVPVEILREIKSII